MRFIEYAVRINRSHDVIIYYMVYFLVCNIKRSRIVHLFLLERNTAAHQAK